MKVVRALVFLAIATVLILSGPSSAQPVGVKTAPAFTPYDFGGYIHALRASTDPQAKAILREIQNGPKDLAAEMAACRKAGIPLTHADLDAPMPPADKNAATIYEKLPDTFATFTYPKNYLSDRHFQRQDYTAEQLTTLSRLFAQNADTMTLLHQAADRPTCVFSKPTSVPTRKMDKYFQWFAEWDRTISRFDGVERLLYMASIVQADQGQFDDAILNATCLARVARQVAGGSGSSYLLIALRFKMLALDDMKHILSVAGPDVSVDTHVSQANAANGETFSFRHAVMTNVPMCFGDEFDFVKSVPDAELAREYPGLFGPDEKSGVARRPLRPEEVALFRRMMDAHAALYLKCIRAIAPVADEPCIPRRAALKRLATLTASYASENDPFLVDIPLDAKLAVDVDLCNANVDAVAAGAAILAIKARTGTFPEVIPVGFIDPFTGKPLGYRREGDNEFVVYSVGPDGKFDGGKPDGKHIPNEAGFRYPTPFPDNALP